MLRELKDRVERHRVMIAWVWLSLMFAVVNCLTMPWLSPDRPARKSVTEKPDPRTDALLAGMTRLIASGALLTDDGVTSRLEALESRWMDERVQAWIGVCACKTAATVKTIGRYAPAAETARALEDFRGRNYDKAEILFRALAAEYPGDPDAHNNYAVALERRGRMPEAQLHLEIVRFAFPHHMPGLLNLAVLYLSAQRRRQFDDFMIMASARSEQSPNASFEFCLFNRQWLNAPAEDILRDRRHDALMEQARTALAQKEWLTVLPLVEEARKIRPDDSALRDLEREFLESAPYAAGFSVGRFMPTKSGTIHDTKTDLEWITGPDRPASYSDAAGWLARIPAENSRRQWRMPSTRQLKELYDPEKGPGHMDPLFKISGSWVWAQIAGTSTAFYFDFSKGVEKRASPNSRLHNMRAFGVRPFSWDNSRVSQGIISAREPDAVQEGNGEFADSLEVNDRRDSHGLHVRVAPEIHVKTSRDGRVKVTPEGIILDVNSGLEWIPGPDRDMDFQEAGAWVRNCQAAGGGWRMPIRIELQGLYQPARGTGNMDRVFGFTGSFVWAEPRDDSSAWGFSFDVGSEFWFPRGLSSYNRVFGVRKSSRR